jgi:hypothetical protein
MRLNMIDAVPEPSPSLNEAALGEIGPKDKTRQPYSPRWRTAGLLRMRPATLPGKPTPT